MGYIIDFIWNKEEGTWIAKSDEIEGLYLESDSLEVLLSNIKIVVPKLLNKVHEIDKGGV